ncbi:alpha/beta-hydrolase [Atractiella rhizophila]|nr:alpha/beta-hydrolase [Atractiella rhizophila]
MVSLRQFSVYFGSLYFAALSILLTPQAQTALLYLSWIRLPLFANYAHPELYGASPGQVRNFKLTTPDGVELGVHHSLPDSLYYAYIAQHGQPSTAQPIPDVYFDEALRSSEHPTLLFLHGNGVTRLFHHRVAFMRAMSAVRAPFSKKGEREVGVQGLNYVTLDYRTYGDSSRHIRPSEKGLLVDARTVWNWILEKGVEPKAVNIAGQSLGCSVSAGLASELSSEGIEPNSVILVAGFQSLKKLLSTYKLFKIFPIMQPIFNVNRNLGNKLLEKFLVDKWDTDKYLKNVKSKILLVHSKDDTEIPDLHSNNIFQSLLLPLLPRVSVESSQNPLKEMLNLGREALEEIAEEYKVVEQEKERIVSRSGGEYWSVKRFQRPEGYGPLAGSEDGMGGGWGDVSFLEIEKGGHNGVITSALTVEWIRRVVAER